MYKGPRFLWNNIEIKEDKSKITEELPGTNEEIKRKCCFLRKVKETISMSFERISKWMKLVHMIAYVTRFIANCKANKEKLKDFLSASEIKNSEEVIIKLVQRESLNEEYTLLLNNEEIKNGRLKVFSPFLHENGIIRVAGRLKWAKIPYEWKHQIILPAKHHITTLIVRKYHNQGHLGPECILLNIRRIYWILKRRSVIKKVGRRCILCQRKRTKNMQPKMSDVLFARLEPMKPPFSSPGIDLFRPVMIKQRRARLKRWGAILSCFTT